MKVQRTEKKMKLHLQKSRKITSFNRIRERLRSSGASIDIARASLYTMGRKAVKDNVDGGEEITDSLELMVYGV